MINKQLFTYIFMGLLCIPAINAMDSDGNKALREFSSAQKFLEDKGLPKEIRYKIVALFSMDEIKKAQSLLEKIDPFSFEPSQHNQIITDIYFLGEKGNKGLQHLLRTNKGKYLRSELSSDEFEQIKSIPSGLLQHVSPYQTIEDFVQDFYEAPKDVLHQEEWRNNLLRIAVSPLLGGCMGGVLVFSASVSALLEGKSLMNKNDAIGSIVAFAALTQAISVVDYLEMEYKYNLSKEEILPIYRKKIDPFKKWRSTGTDFKDYVNSQRYKDWQRSIALTE
jgi:hypothetical protein